MTPDGDADSAAGDQHPFDLGYGCCGGAPDAAEAGHHVEAGVPPGKGVHIAHVEICRGIAVAGHRYQSNRGVNAGADRSTQMRQLEGQATPACHVEEPITVFDGELVVPGVGVLGLSLNLPPSLLVIQDLMSFCEAVGGRVRLHH